MIMGHDICHEALSQAEEAIRSAWTGSNSTPFLVDAPITPDIRAQAEHIAAKVRLSVLFARFPTLAIWSVLTPLARNYGADGRDVYRHISAFTGEAFADPSSRSVLKDRFRAVARELGLPVHGTHPTELFFAPLGPAHSQHDDLARAFVASAIALGPPAGEDTAAARSWQRQAVRTRCHGLVRLQATITFDQSAWCARRFEAWRRGAAPLSPAEADLFSAYDAAAKSYGRSRKDITGPPRIYWTGESLALEAESSPHPQRIRASGPFPVQIPGGGRRTIEPPWPKTVQWTCAAMVQAVPLAPAPGEVLVFDADTGALLARAEALDETVDVAAERLVILAGAKFEAASFGPALPAADPDYRVAWIAPGQTLRFNGRAPLAITAPLEPAIWIDATPIGKCGSRALLTRDGRIRIQLDPAIGGRQRILRARLGTEVKFTPLCTDASGMAEIALDRIGFSSGLAPGRAVFEVLAPGTVGDPGARAELAAAAWIWPGLRRPEGEITELPVPANHDPSRSAGLRVEGDRLLVDLRMDVEAPILGLRDNGETREFSLDTGAERLWHCRLARGDRLPLPRGARLILGHAGRHDRLILHSPDREADLLVLGQVLKRPFHSRSRLEITAEMLQRPEEEDDRIALRRKDGRIDILARLGRVRDPSVIEITGDDRCLVLSITPQLRYDALRLVAEGVDGSREEGDIALSHRPVDAAEPPWASCTVDFPTRRLTLTLLRSYFKVPTRVSLSARCDDESAFRPIIDQDGARIVLGLGDLPGDPDRARLHALARFLADPVPAELEAQISETLGAAYAAAIASVGASRLVGAVQGVLTVTRADGAPPRHDLAGVAPWIFEASGRSFGQLPEACGLAPLMQLDSAGPAPELPDPEGDTPLASWLARIGRDPDLPAGLDAATLQHGFRILRHRLADSDLRCLLGAGRHGIAARLICDTWSEATDDLRRFDSSGGGDDRPARLAIALERFARAAALRRPEAHIEALVFRTGLTRAEIGATLTLMLRAGIEFFVHFRTLWSHAERQKKDRQ